MNKFKKIGVILFLLVLISCQRRTQEQDSAVLTSRTNILIDLFLNETREWLTNKEQLVIRGGLDDAKKHYYLYICAHDPEYTPYGEDCNGIVHYKDYKILLFGDSWNNYFWRSDSIYSLSDSNTKEWDEYFYDPPVWELYISLKDTSISDVHSELVGYYNPYQILDISDEMVRNRKDVLDSIQNIIRQ